MPVQVYSHTQQHSDALAVDTELLDEALDELLLPCDELDEDEALTLELELEPLTLAELDELLGKLLAADDELDWLDELLDMSDDELTDTEEEDGTEDELETRLDELDTLELLLEELLDETLLDDELDELLLLDDELDEGTTQQHLFFLFAIRLVLLRRQSRTAIRQSATYSHLKTSQHLHRPVRTKQCPSCQQDPLQSHLQRNPFRHAP